MWVTLNESDRSNVPDFGLEMYEQYNWYFPYVNERLRLLPSVTPMWSSPIGQPCPTRRD